ncbi:MAG: sigma-54-dependent Fis family transcriptional regulator [Bacteroidetes bacterium]|nr:MAG: sigma-54-dependent Fis family transcriptional regulator [Bacteroidota bacterium]
MAEFSIFVVDDDTWYTDFLTHHIELNPDFKVQKFHSGKSLLQSLHLRPDVISLDYNLPDIAGEKLIERIQEESPHTEIMIVSGQNDISIALNLVRTGISDYLVKDQDIKERIWNALLNATEKIRLKKEIERLNAEVSHKYDFSNSIIGHSQALKKVFVLLEKACKSNINVSIHGETGTGKELVAKAIHFHSKRSKKPFIAINVSAIPKDLIESELFGHEKGSFTGAIQQRIGKFEEANGGTLFLDEIAEMDIHTQVKLLRVLQEREITRIGSNKPIPIDCRIITATHKNLEEEVRLENFREDLFYRIIGLSIELPPLRDRSQDIMELGKHFSSLFASENGVSEKVFSEEACKKLMEHKYPGNVRELKSIIDLAMVLADGETIESEHVIIRVNPRIESLFGTEMTLRELNNRVIELLLQKYDNDISKVASILDIGKSTIYRLIKDKEINNKN